MPLQNSNPEVRPRLDVARTYIGWTFARAIFHRGWWLVTSLYLVVDAGLSPLELVLVGTAQQLTAITFEIPTGVIADTVSRKWSIVVAHFAMGAGMLLTGLVIDFWPLMATQMLWGLSWTFSSGADVAWLTDELDRPERVDRVLTASARFEQLGSACGLVLFGLLAWGTALSAAIVTAGSAMLVLGVFVAFRFTERNFQPTQQRRLSRSASILRQGIGLARGDREILVLFAATALVNGAAEIAGRLDVKQLVELGFPEATHPIVWLTLLGLVALVLAALALRFVEGRIDGVGVARRVYATACAVGALGLVVLALAPSVSMALAGILLARSITWPLTRTVGVIWVNRRARTEVRATVQSLLAQAEYAGEIALGLSLAVVAQVAGLASAFIGAGALLLLTAALVFGSRARWHHGRADRRLNSPTRRSS